MKRERKIRTGTAVISVLAAVLAAFAQAQDHGQRPLTAPFHSNIPEENRADSVTPDSVSPTLKSESTALTYSLVGTLLPTATLVLAAPGLIVGPSAGYFYAGMPGRAWIGIGIRTIGIGGMASAFVICGWDCTRGQSAYDVAWAVFLSSAGIVAFSAAYDIATVKAAVRERNSSLMKLGDTITPVYFADSDAFGLKLNYRF